MPQYTLPEGYVAPDAVAQTSAGIPGVGVMGDTVVQMPIQQGGPTADEWQTQVGKMRQWSQSDYENSVAGATARANAEAADKQFVQDMIQQGQVQNALKAVEAGRRQLGLSRFVRRRDELLRAGASETAASMSAISESGADIFGSNPATFLNSQKWANPVAVKAPEERTMGGVPGVVQPSGNWVRNVQPKPATKPRSPLISSMQAQMKEIDTQIETIEATPGWDIERENKTPLIRGDSPNPKYAKPRHDALLKSKQELAKKMMLESESPGSTLAQDYQNAPEEGEDASPVLGESPETPFQNEDQARAAGHKAKAKVYLVMPDKSVKRVQLR